MSKKSDAFGGLLLLIGIITFTIKWIFNFIIENWVILTPIFLILLSISIYFYWKESKKDKRLDQSLNSHSEIDYMEGIDFEYFVANLLNKLGFKTKVTQASNDYGVDIIGSKNGDKYAIQVKRQESNVSRRAVSDAVGGMKIYNCNKSMVITNSYFSQGAIDLAEANNCILIDRNKLIEWLVLVNNKISVKK